MLPKLPHPTLKDRRKHPVQESKALTGDDSYVSFFDATAIETTIPQVIKDRAKKYVWSDGEDGYPPHLKVIPKNDPYDAPQRDIFNNLGLVNAFFMLKGIVPEKFRGAASEKVWSLFEGVVNGRNDTGASIRDLETNNKNVWRRKTATDVMQGHNIGDLPDWWSDSRYAQQQFTGTNPTTICLASSHWVQDFKKAAHAQGQAAAYAKDFLASVDPKSLYVQDCSYFREAVHAEPLDTLQSKDQGRYACATVSLFHLSENGQLHPLAIVIDFKGSMDNSVVVFNKRMTPIAPDAPETERTKLLEQEKEDWPWRYAKTCAQVSDWIRHEIAIHLVNTHMMEEVLIVAANRCFEITHPVFKLLEPHWYRTLPLNAAARDTLVPSIVFDLVGLKGEQPKNFIRHAFDSFHFTDSYVPTDLAKRGFPIEDLEKDKFKNYPYAKNMIHMWRGIRTFVKSMIDLHYEADAQVSNNDRIRAWCHEVQNAGQIPTFPTIKTKDQLIDAITMCVHIASPQHTAVNYLQNFYQAFVPAKPPALYKPLPGTLSELKTITEPDLIRALPVGHQRDWLLAAHVPWLLSFKTAKDNSLLHYAESLYNLVRKKSGADNERTMVIATEFYQNLREMIILFKKNSDKMTPGTVPYVVMDPAATAVSILI